MSLCREMESRVGQLFPHGGLDGAQRAELGVHELEAARLKHEEVQRVLEAPPPPFRARLAVSPIRAALHQRQGALTEPNTTPELPKVAAAMAIDRRIKVMGDQGQQTLMPAAATAVQWPRP